MLARLRHYRFDWKLSLLTVLLLPLLVSLGFWQLAREQEKLALEELYEARREQSPQALDTLDIQRDLQYTQAWVEGEFDNEHLFLLDNRVHAGRAGYEVLVPLMTDSGWLVFVNRGWVGQGASRADLPVPPALPAQARVQGNLYQPLGEAFVLGGAELIGSGWPRVVQTLDMALMAAQLDGSWRLFPYSLRLAANEPGVLVRDWPTVNMSSTRHRGYAVQWFAMATALVLLYLYYSTRANADLKDEPQAKP